MGWLVSVVVVLVLLGPVSASAQSPTTPAHPALPWSLGPAIPQGQLMQYNYAPAGSFVRDIWIPPQPVVVDMMVALPSSSAPPRTTEARDSDTQPSADTQYGVLRQSFVVPGYYVRETTVGFHYPERWVLDQSYTWQLVPAQFWPRSTVLNPSFPPAPVSAPTLGSAGSPAPPLVTPSLGSGSFQPVSVPSLR
jgi:hypothetical protein